MIISLYLIDKKNISAKFIFGCVYFVFSLSFGKNFFLKLQVTANVKVHYHPLLWQSQNHKKNPRNCFTSMTSLSSILINLKTSNWFYI